MDNGGGLGVNASTKKAKAMRPPREKPTRSTSMVVCVGVVVVVVVVLWRVLEDSVVWT